MTTKPEKRYLCTDCRRRFATVGARRQHWRTTKCEHGHGTTIGSNHPVAVTARTQDFGQWVAGASKEARRDVFESVADDLPDGAYFAMAEEFGLGPDDLGE
jgi:hypothetical protein